MSKSARVLRRSSGRRREPKCSALKGGFLCSLEVMVKVDCTVLCLGESALRGNKNGLGTNINWALSGLGEGEICKTWSSS